MSTIKATTLSNLAGSKTVPTDTVVDGSAKAWVNFNGTGTVAIRRAFNVSSITDNGTGDYTVNFTNAMVDASYSSVIGAGLGNAAVNWMICFPNTKGVSNFIQAPTSSAMRFVLSGDAKSTGLDDAQFVNVAIFS